MQLSLKEIIRNTFIKYVWLPAFFIFCVVAIGASYWIKHQMVQFDETLLESNRQVILQHTLSGDTIALKRQIIAMAQLAKWDFVQVAQIDEVILAAWTNGVSKTCDKKYSLIDETGNQIATICYSYNIFMKSLSAFLPFLLGMILIYILYFFSIKKIEFFLESFSSRFTQISNAIMEKNETYFANVVSQSLEENIFVETFNMHFQNEVLQRRKEMENERNLIFAGLAEQVAHDIRSPLSALNVISSSIVNLSIEKKTLLKGAIQRINEISNDLLVKSTGEANFEKTDREFKPGEIIYLPFILELIAMEKRLQSEATSEFVIETNFSEGVNSFAFGSAKELKRVLSNILNNSIESLIKGRGQIKIRLRVLDGFTLIEITDNGRGIPDHIIQLAGKKRVSSGKEGTSAGSGIGLLHAFNTIEAMNGRIELNSEKSEMDGKIFTTVSIQLPLITQPKWFAATIALGSSSSLVLVDEDQSFYPVLSEIVNANQSLKTKVTLHNFSSLRDFKSWFLSLDNVLNAKYIFGSDFTNDTIDVFTLIEGLDISKSTSILTNNFDDKLLQNRCIAEGLQIIPKVIGSSIVIQFA